MKTMWIIIDKTEEAVATLNNVAARVPCFVTWHGDSEAEICCRAEDAAFIEREIAHLV